MVAGQCGLLPLVQLLVVLVQTQEAEHVLILFLSLVAIIADTPVVIVGLLKLANSHASHKVAQVENGFIFLGVLTLRRTTLSPVQHLDNFIKVTRKNNIVFYSTKVVM